MINVVSLVILTGATERTGGNLASTNELGQWGGQAEKAGGGGVFKMKRRSQRVGVALLSVVGWPLPQKAIA